MENSGDATNIKNAAGALLDAFGKVATDEVAQSHAKKFLSNAFENVTNWTTSGIEALTNSLTGIADGSYTEDSLEADLNAYIKENGLDPNNLDAASLAGFTASIGTPLAVQVVAGAIGVDIKSTVSNLFSRIKNIANDASDLKGASPKQEAPKEDFNLLSALMNRDFGAISGEIKSWFSNITSLLGTAKTAASAWGGEIGGTVNSFIDTISGALSSIIPNIGGMLSGFIPGFSFSDDAPQDDGPTAEEKADLLTKEQAAEAQRQQALAREQEQQRQQQDVASSPDSSKEDFSNAHDDKQTPREVEEQVIASNPALKNVLNSSL